MKKWFGNRNGAHFFLLLGIGLMMVYAALEWSLPRADQLQTSTGRVQWTQVTASGLYFSINNDPGRFVIYAKGDSDGRLRQAVRDAEFYPVAVRYNHAQRNRAGVGPGDYYVAYGIAVGGKDVVSVDEVRSAYRRDNLVALVMGAIFAAYGAHRIRTTSRRADDGTPASRRSR